MKARLGWFFAVLATLALFLFTVAACGPTAIPATHQHEGEQEHVGVDEMPALAAVSLGAGEKLQVVATTSIVADVVRNVAGEQIDLTVLIPPGTDPHTFEPTPKDIAAVAEAHVVFANGAGLEFFLERLLASAGGEVKVVPVSHSIELRRVEAEHETKDEAEHEHDEFDPHVWFDPNNVRVWVYNITQALRTLDPDNAETYVANASAYETLLQALDAWILGQVDHMAAANRKLVTDHTVFGYFADRYGFEQIGVVFPGYSTLAEPSAQELAELQAMIAQFDVKAIFVGVTINASLPEQIAADTGTKLVFLYTGSLSASGGPADSYLDMMRYNVTAIIEALR